VMMIQAAQCAVTPGIHAIDRSNTCTRMLHVSGLLPAGCKLCEIDEEWPRR